MPAIISEDLWKRVKIKMDSNKINKGANTAKAIYLLSGLIYCGKCGSAMTGNRRYAGRNKSLYETYECSNRKRTKQCDMKAINKDYVEQVVIDDLYNNIFSDSAIENIVPDIFSFISEQNKIINEDIKIYKKELANIQTKIDNMLDAIANGFYNSSMKEKSDQLETRKTTLLIRINEAEREAKLNSPTEDMIKNI